jgi:endonuclease-8
MPEDVVARPGAPDAPGVIDAAPERVSPVLIRPPPSRASPSFLPFLLDNKIELLLSIPNFAGTRMPEGPECHVIAWRLGEYCKGQRILSVAVHGGRYRKPNELTNSNIDAFNATLGPTGSAVVRVEAHGKLVYAVLDNGYAMLSTMGLSGSWVASRGTHCDVSLRLRDQHGTEKTIWFRDQLHYGTIKFVTEEELNRKLERLGPDVLRGESGGCTLEWWQKLCKRKSEWTLPKLLLEQSQVAGVGNYLKAEALYQARASPIAKIRAFSEAELGTVWHAVYDVSNRCFAWKAYKARIPGHGPVPRFLMKVYNKGVDSHRNKVIKTKTTDGRSTHWVPAVHTLPGRGAAGGEAAIAI